MAEAAYDWSPDGQTLLVTKGKVLGQERDIGYEPILRKRDVSACALPIAAAPHAEAQERVIISDPNYSIFQEHFSPDGKWIVFEALEHRIVNGAQRSTLYAMRAAGGPWVA